MKSDAQTPLHRLAADGEEFLCARLPDADGEAERLISAALNRQKGSAPNMIYWDARVGGGEGVVHFGHGGLDPILASQHDLSNCVAVSRSALDRLVQRQAIRGTHEIARAAALLSRAPGTRSIWCEGLIGAFDPAAPGPLVYSASPATTAETISICLLVSDKGVAVEPFFAALRGQALTAQLDVVAISAGLEADDQKTLVRELDAAASADPRLKIRRYSLTGVIDPAYLANIAVALAQREAVILADARCTPITPTIVQRLADWALSGDIIAACPRLIFQQKLIAAGLAFVARDQETVLRAWGQSAFSEGLRTLAAPAPGLFALRRSAWVDAGGVRGVAERGLWTAELAFGHGPKGRTVLIGSEIAEWIGRDRPFPVDLVTLAHRNEQTSASTALRDPVAGEAFVPSGGYARAAAGRGSARPESVGDAFPSRAELRLLVVADAVGASQSIVFLDGLKDARERGRVAIRIVGENAFPPDGRAADDAEAAALVDQLVAETEPHLLIASRLGHGQALQALKAAAQRHGLPLVFHIDDDLLDLPALIGVERWRRGRNPQRMRALQEGLDEADWILATTPALARTLEERLGRKRVLALTYGTAGRPRHRRPGSRERVRIAYMGSASHEADLQLVAPALERVMADFNHVDVVLFGSIAEQPAALALKGRVQRLPPVVDGYGSFRDRLAQLDIDIGLAPLRPTLFNQLKTPTKWVEYAEAGAAVAATPLGPYAPFTAGGAALGAQAFEWETVLRRMIESPGLRADLVGRADEILRAQFGWDALEADVMNALGEARSLTRAAA